MPPIQTASNEVNQDLKVTVWINGPIGRCHQICKLGNLKPATNLAREEGLLLLGQGQGERFLLRLQQPHDPIVPPRTGWCNARDVRWLISHASEPNSAPHHFIPSPNTS